MRLQRFTWVLGSGLVWYATMTACAALGGGGSSDPASSTSSSSGSSGPVPNAMANTWYASGSRLRVRFLEGADGSKQFWGWFDSARGEECSFLQHADGSIRCLPDRPANLATYFASNACTTPLAYANRGAVAPKYAVRFDPSGGRSVFPVSGPVHTGGVWLLSGANCVDASSSKSSLDFFPVGSEIAAGEFVLATPKSEP